MTISRVRLSSLKEEAWFDPHFTPLETSMEGARGEPFCTIINLLFKVNSQVVSNKRRARLTQPRTGSGGALCLHCSERGRDAVVAVNCLGRAAFQS